MYNKKKSPQKDPCLEYLEQHTGAILALKDNEKEHQHQLEQLLEQTKGYFEKNYKVLNPTFMRKLYNLIKSGNNLFDLKLKVPEILYYAARQQDRSKKESSNLASLFEQIIQKASHDNHIKSIHYFAECTIAYHTYYKETN